MKLRNINYLITTSQPIRLYYPTGENRIADIDSFRRYEDYRVTSLWCKNNELNIELMYPEEDTDEEAEVESTKDYINILSYLLKNYTEQIIDLYTREECPNDLENILSDVGISSSVLDKYQY